MIFQKNEQLILTVLKLVVTEISSVPRFFYLQSKYLKINSFALVSRTLSLSFPLPLLPSYLRSPN